MTRLLHHEAELLDSGRLEEWLELLADEITYRGPVRLTRERGDAPDHSTEMVHFDDDRETLQLRVNRLKTDFAWAEDPPSRTRHFITNIRVDPTSTEAEVKVRSYFLLYRNRGAQYTADLLSGERHDVWLRAGGALKLAERVVFMDQATLGTKNLAIFV